MKLHYDNTEIAYAPMMEGEMQYWLSKGYTLFLHCGIWWMKIMHHSGHRVLIQADAHEVQQLLNKRFYEQIGIIVRMKQEYRNAYSK